MAKKENTPTETSLCSFRLTLDEQGKLDREANKLTKLSHQGTRTDVIRNLIKKLK